MSDEAIALRIRGMRATTIASEKRAYHPSACLHTFVNALIAPVKMLFTGVASHAPQIFLFNKKHASLGAYISSNLGTLTKDFPEYCHCECKIETNHPLEGGIVNFKASYIGFSSKRLITQNLGSSNGPLLRNTFCTKGIVNLRNHVGHCFSLIGLFAQCREKPLNQAPSLFDNALIGLPYK